MHVLLHNSEDALATIINEDVIGWLREVDYPADRDDLIRIARRAGTPAATLELLRALPRGNFNGVYDLRRAMARRQGERTA
ncbi:MAG TPA: DUF2795 domain-containing protein [Humibacter sp.]|nr:DUF2795 domain-containing protein [Humibacter sp.]